MVKNTTKKVPDRKPLQRTKRMSCPFCGSTDLGWATGRPLKSGRMVPSGKEYYCKRCNEYFTAREWGSIKREVRKHPCYGCMAISSGEFGYCKTGCDRGRTRPTAAALKEFREGQ